MAQFVGCLSIRVLIFLSLLGEFGPSNYGWLLCPALMNGLNAPSLLICCWEGYRCLLLFLFGAKDCQANRSEEEVENTVWTVLAIFSQLHQQPILGSWSINLPLMPEAARVRSAHTAAVQAQQQQRLEAPSSFTAALGIDRCYRSYNSKCAKKVWRGPWTSQGSGIFPRGRRCFH